MKRFICLLLAVTSLLFGCNGKGNSDIVDTTELNNAITSANNEKLLSGNYMLEISFGQGSVLYYANGDIDWDRENKKVSADFSQTYLGVSSDLKNYFSDGKMISVEDGKAVTVDRNADELLSKFPYFIIPFPEKEVSKGSNSSGTAYSFKIENSKNLCENIIGGDIYSLVNVLSKPQKDKTQYGVADCIYTVKEGKIVSARYGFDIKLFDTPSYTPGYSQPEEEYTLTVHITAKVAYNAFGNEVTIGEYSKESEQSK